MAWHDRSASPPSISSGRRYRARRLLESPTRQVLTTGAAFTLGAAVSASQLHLSWANAGVGASYLGLLGLRLLEWWLWALLVPAVVALQRRLQREELGRWAIAGGHLGLATLWFGLLNALLVGLTPPVDPTPGLPFASAYLSRAMLRLTTAWAISGLILAAILALADFVRRQALTRDLVAARRAALRSQIQLHFLFNPLRRTDRERPCRGPGTVGRRPARRRRPASGADSSP